MKYKILISSNDGTSNITYQFYKVSTPNDNSKTVDWESDNAADTEEMLKELLNTYGLSRLKVVVDLPVDISVVVPEVTTNEGTVEETNLTPEENGE